MVAWYVVILTGSAVVPRMALALSEVDYSGSNVTGLVEDTIALPGISISSDDLTVPVNLSVDSGILSMTTTTGLSFSTDATGTNISFTGSVSDINDALATLQYRTLNSGTVTVTASILEEGDVYFPSNGHMYEVVDAGGPITANDARTAAAALTKNDANGYLATITTQAEFDYISDRLTGDGWFGAADDVTEDDWQWISGPEAGTSFWAGLSDGSPVGGLFSHWASGEPNNSGDEDCGQFYSGGSGWNDLPCDGVTLGYYVVEYGAPGDLPTAPPNASFTITTSEPTAQDVLIASCLDLIDVYDNGSENRYDNLKLTADIDCTGEDLAPLFTEEDPDFSFIGFRGDFDGQGHTISHATVNKPGESFIGLIGYTNDAVIHDITISGDVTGDMCTGGIVGDATDSTFQNVTSSVNVTGGDRTGGIVGCYEGEAGTGEIADSTATGTVSGYDTTGGLVGSADVVEDAEFSINGSSFSGTVDSEYSGISPILGQAYAYGTSLVTLESNTNAGIDVPDAVTVGGVVGNVYTQDSGAILVKSNTVTGEVRAGATVGGLIGSAYNDGSDDSITIQNSSISTNVTSTDGDNVGGLVGYGEDVHITRSYFSGLVTGADDEVGGLIGESSDSSIDESYVLGDVDGNDGFVGGLVGRNAQTTITKSYATGDVTGDDRVGGLVGANGGEISDSYARGTVTGNDQVGGLAGRCGGEINRSYATGVVDGSTNVGGLIGADDSCDTADSFWDTETTMQASSPTGTGKTTVEMKTEATYTDLATDGLDSAWDFAAVWNLNESANDGYPCLQWHSGVCDVTEDDDDGIPAEVEAAAPNGGDANNDGTPDAEQPNVSSFVNPTTGEYATLVVDASCTIQTISAGAESVNALADPGYEYPAGLLDFDVNCGTPGFTTTITQYFFGLSTNGLVLRKYKSSNQSYTTITGASLVQATIGGKSVVEATYSITDGGIYDDDGAVNGTIVDPAGVALGVVGVPNTGLGGSQR